MKNCTLKITNSSRNSHFFIVNPIILLGTSLKQTYLNGATDDTRIQDKVAASNALITECDVRASFKSVN
jgi:hypothetical protein